MAALEKNIISDAEGEQGRKSKLSLIPAVLPGYPDSEGPASFFCSREACGCARGRRVRGDQGF